MIKTSLAASKQVSIPMLLYNGRVAGEIRPAYFLKAVGLEPLPMAIFSFGRCNFRCRYCKRGGQFIDDQGNIMDSCMIQESQLFELVREHIREGNVIRLSGGDPCLFPDISLSLLKYVASLGGTTSIAHNGSSPGFVKLILPFLHFASIDVKAALPEEFAYLTGLSFSKAQKCLENAYRTIELLLQNGKIVDVRTPVFSGTHLNELEMIAARLKETAGDSPLLFWTLRSFSPVPGFERTSPSPDTLKHYARHLANEYGIKIGVRSKWEPGGFLFF